jgi:hypothetical protein
LIEWLSQELGRREAGVIPYDKMEDFFRANLK